MHAIEALVGNRPQHQQSWNSQNNPGAIRIRMVIAMTVIAKPFAAAVHLFHWPFSHLSSADRRRRQATIDLINASPHLLRDIGATEDKVVCRKK